MLEVDARGFSCPIPVVKTKKAIDQNAGTGDQITVLVNEDTSKENVTRLARGNGYSVKVEELSREYRLILTPQ